MKPRTVIILVGIVIFAAVVVLALLREMERDEAELVRAISGIVEVSNEMVKTGLADIARTDRIALMLIDPVSGEVVALRFESPLVPPQNISIGQLDARGGRSLEGEYYVMGITDKDGDVARVTPGEVFGKTLEPVAIGSKRVRLLLDRPFKGIVPRLAPDTPPQSGTGRRSDY